MPKKTQQELVQISKANSIDSGFLPHSWSNRIPFVNGDVPTPLILIVLLCVYCYLHEKIESEEEFQKYAVWIPMTAMIGLFISFESSSYWYLHLCPYLSIMLVYNTKNLKNNVLFETVGLIAITLSNFGSRPWAFEIYGCHTMLLEKIFGDYNAVQEVYLLNDFAHRISIVKYVGALTVIGGIVQNQCFSAL